MSAERTETRIIVILLFRSSASCSPPSFYSVLAVIGLFFRPQSDLRGLPAKIDKDQLANRKKVVNINPGIEAAVRGSSKPLATADSTTAHAFRKL